jgi:CDP-glucose 4,6-dehydratase
LIPDFLRALDAGKTLTVRSPHAIRPWQHVLEPLSGYLLLAEKLFTGGNEFADAWNFGPSDEGAKPVSWILDQLCTLAPTAKWHTEIVKQPHEAGVLKLDSSKAKTQLGWAPRWNLSVALNKTIEWHQAWRDKEDMAALTSAQIQEYQGN